MSQHDDLPPLEDDLRSLLEAERTRADVPPEVADSIYEKVVTNVPPTPAKIGAAAPSRKASRHESRAVVPAWSIPAALLVGAFVGGTVVKSRELPPPRASLNSQPTTDPIQSANPAPLAIASAPPVAVVPSTTVTSSVKSASMISAAPTPAPSASVAKTDTLPRERALLEVARTAFGKNDAQGTLDALDRHRNEFPDGKLSEERDALTIEALVEAGKNDEARARGRQFHLSYPDSILRPAVDDALKSIP